MTRYQDTTAVPILLNHNHSNLPVGMIEIENEIIDMMGLEKGVQYGLCPGGRIDEEGNFQLIELSLVKINPDVPLELKLKEEC